MKILILCIVSLLLVSCGALKTSKNPQIEPKDDHAHGVETHTHDEKGNELTAKEKDTNIAGIEVFEPIIPVSDFGSGIEGVSEISKYIESLSGSTIKIHGSLYLSSGELLKNEKITYGYNVGSSFEKVGSTDSDEGGQYYFKLIPNKLSQDLFYTDILIGEVVSRIYFVQSDFNANTFVTKHDGLPQNMYFAKSVILDDEIITGVDILANPS